MCKKLVVILLLFNVCVYAQEPVSNRTISPSTDVSSVARFIENPVDLTTGIVDIQVPLYAIKSAKLSYPVSLNYHAGGFKVNEGAGWTGLGWSLSGPGIITRVMRGLPDEGSKGYFSYANAIPNSNDVISIAQRSALAMGRIDMIPDLFYYNIGSLSGKIIFDNQLQPVTIPKQDVKISVSNTTTLDNFSVTSNDGTLYEFKSNERTRSHSTEGSKVYDLSYLSTWYLSRIISADRTDTIKFSYTTLSTSYVSNYSETLKYYYNVPAGSTKNEGRNEHDVHSIAVTIENSLQLSSIEYGYGKLVFETSPRTDNASARKLESIAVYSKDAVTKALVFEKAINFGYGYFAGSNMTVLRLDYIQQRGTSGITNPKTSFKYFDPFINMGTYPFDQDYWGYFNGPRLNAGLMPTAVNSNGVQIAGTYPRAPYGSSTYLMLNQITNPLGGVTEFQYESNQYKNGAGTIRGPGARIKTIIKRDPYSAIKDTTNYEYLIPGSTESSGVLLNNPTYFTEMGVRDRVGGNDKFYNCKYGISNPTDVGSFSGPSLVYQYVTTYKGAKKKYAGKSVYTFNVSSYGRSVDYPYLSTLEDSFLGGTLEQVQHYAVNGTNETLVKQIVNNYATSPTFATVKGMKGAFINLLANGGDTLTSDLNLYEYRAYSKFNYLSKSSENNYEQGSGALASQTTRYFFYDKTNVHLQLTSDSVSTSEKGVTLLNEYTYPLDYPATGTMGVMQNLNMISAPVERKTIRIQNKVASVTSYSKVEYTEFKPLQVYAQNLYKSKIGTPVARATFNANPTNYCQLGVKLNQYTDEGFLGEIETVDDIPRAIIVNKTCNKPVAQIDAARLNQVAYSSFESSDFGQWSITAGATTKTTALTLNQNNGFTSFTLNASQKITFTYTVTRTSGAIPVFTFYKAGSTPIEYELVLSSGSGSVTLPSGTWNASLSYEDNVSSAVVNFSYTSSQQNALNIISTDYKTGAMALSLTNTNIISKTNLPAGDYIVQYFQKGSSSVTLTLSGSASLLSSVTTSADASGWKILTKSVRIVLPTDVIKLTGSSVTIDELRLYPLGATMQTMCYDSFRRLNTQTDLNLQSQFYEYDDWGRITVVRDNSRNILQFNEYKVAGN